MGYQSRDTQLYLAHHQMIKLRTLTASPLKEPKVVLHVVHTGQAGH